MPSNKNNDFGQVNAKKMFLNALLNASLLVTVNNESDFWWINATILNVDQSFWLHNEVSVKVFYRLSDEHDEQFHAACCNVWDDGKFNSFRCGLFVSRSDQNATEAVNEYKFYGEVAQSDFEQEGQTARMADSTIRLPGLIQYFPLSECQLETLLTTAQTWNSNDSDWRINLLYLAVLSFLTSVLLAFIVVFKNSSGAAFGFGVNRKQNGGHWPTYHPSQTIYLQLLSAAANET